MSAETLIECVPNFSEGQNEATLQAITAAIESVPATKLLHKDVGYSAHRTVFTFAGPPEAVVESAFEAIRIASEFIDMRMHKGTHPRLGATDVCPLIPLANISMDEVKLLAYELAKRVGNELHIPVYLYEKSAIHRNRKNLATIRKGEYEGLELKLAEPKWKPDFGPNQFNAINGATVIGARNFLLAYNLNLNTIDVKVAKAIAEEMRESGKVITKEGKKERIPGKFKALKAIGWFIEEFDCAQVSMNLIDFHQTNLHDAFEGSKEIASKYGVEVTGSELIGMAPLEVFLKAGKFYEQKELSEEELVKSAIQNLGLSQLTPFNPHEKVIEYKLMDL
ncbi:MAG: glutamate formimidoyltransferase [Bacteroidota bacterium]